MAGKHSKNFLDILKEAIKFNNTSCVTNPEKPPMLLSFKIVIAVLVLSLAVSTIWISAFFIPSRANRILLGDTAVAFESENSADALVKLKGKNNDIKGWLKVEGTNINYPVCQSQNDTFYINHNHLGKKSRYGALSLQRDDSFNKKDTDYNTVIYGNNMKDGSMFGELKRLRDINFYKSNPTAKLFYEDKSETYVIFAVMVTSSSQRDKKGAFDPTQGHFENEKAFNKWFVEISKRSLIKPNIPLSYGDDILTLVTVADDFDNARLIVMAKRLQDVEVPYINTSSAVINPNPQYPKEWYEEKGLKYPY